MNDHALSSSQALASQLSSTKATIIIAAYNEASVIRNTLQRLTKADALSSYQILVVCNGCTDNTAQIIRDNFPKVHCHSLAVASKALAIRHAESLKPGFPRMYLDADIELSAEHAASLIAKAGAQRSAALLIPCSIVATTSCSTWVKAFYRAWYNTPHVQAAGYGCGSYLLNQAGRERFGDWPELVADDAFVRSQFATDEVHIVRTVTVGVKAPKSLWSLIKVKARSKFGNLQLKDYAKHNGIEHNHGKAKTELNTTSASMPVLHCGDTIIYLMINLIALCLAKWQFLTDTNRWHRDNSNR